MKTCNDWSAKHSNKAKENIDYYIENTLLDFVGLVSKEMERKNISKAELARRLDKKRSFISRIFNCNHNITLKTMIAISRELEIDLKITGEAKNKWIEKTKTKTLSENNLPENIIQGAIPMLEPAKLTNVQLWENKISISQANKQTLIETSRRLMHYQCNLLGVCTPIEKQDEEFTNEEVFTRVYC